MLVVCHGNVCRSPLAAAVLRRYLPEYKVRSRALKHYPATERRTLPPAMRKVRDYAVSVGLELAGHRAAQITEQDAAWADVILYMDGPNREWLEEFLRPDERAKMICLATFVGETRIPDPAFLPVGQELNRVLDKVVQAANNYGRSLSKEKATPA